MNFRHRAKQCLESAKQNINEGTSRSLRYAALDLRMALEALMYEKAKSYIGELPEKDINTWQPRILLKKLLEIDPSVELNTSFSGGLQASEGVPAKEMSYYGTDRVLSFKEIKTYYDRLGSYLHTPTVNQVNTGKIASNEKIQGHCENLIKIIMEVLSSPVFNINIKHRIDWECNNCNKTILRRIPISETSFEANCPHCLASYKVEVEEDNSYTVKPLTQKLICSNSSCNKENSLWHSFTKLGNKWKCCDCGTVHVFLLSYQSVEKLNS